MGPRSLAQSGCPAPQPASRYPSPAMAALHAVCSRVQYTVQYTSATCISSTAARVRLVVQAKAAAVELRAVPYGSRLASTRPVFLHTGTCEPGGSSVFTFVIRSS